MGNYRSHPATEIESEQGEGAFYKFAAASMQGWRINQEDAHACLPNFDQDKDISLFAVFDGHGGFEVAKYCAENLPEHIKNDLSYKHGDFKEALEEAFMSFDKSLRTPEVIKKLKDIMNMSTGDAANDSDFEPEDVNGLLEEACTPLEKVLQKYMKDKLKDDAGKVNGSAENKEAEENGGEGGSSSGAGGSSGVAEPASAGGSGGSPGRPGRGERKKSSPKEKGSKEEKESTDESSEEDDDETFDSEDEEGTSGSEESGGESGTDEDDEEGDDEEDMENETPGHMWLMRYLKRKRMAEELSSDEEGEEGAPPKKRKPVLTGLNSTPGIESGTTAVVALLAKDKVTVANIGDSRAILGRVVKGEDGVTKVIAVELSKDHKPELPEEKERIENAGGEVDDDGRVDGGLNLSRAFGDFVFKANKELPAEKQEVIAFPDIITQEISSGDKEEDKFLFVACDGIWNDMTSDEVANFVWDRLSLDVSLNDILEQMFKEILAPNLSGDGTGCDNMTAVLVQFNKDKPKDNQVEAPKEGGSAAALDISDKKSQDATV
ncbi:uncharacterized protein LOC132193785 [Neocloeon triangulifer]|uniref:uncharacterized protein LOC132193785 n=1 Tax=Neocloeon triangulifer TaxID=2078957 RepID=UPI00286F634A|nr:uncharacterized protein LOC132193785 [Neocloeon triangulifer]